MISVGDVIETRKSHLSGIVLEVGSENRDGSVRLRIDTPEGERWTTY
jgi:hypothetical protein